MITGGGVGSGGDAGDARIRAHIANLVAARLRTDVEDHPRCPVELLVAGRYRVLAGMGRRYARAAGQHPAAATMLSVVYQLAGSDRLSTI